ncbi:MAG: NAD-dependent epimerase/dehydratase family protein [Solirubrobacterales bacterium]
MTTLVTGASGHVGGAIARRLITSGDEVFALGRQRPELPGLAGWVEADLGATAGSRLAELVAATIGTRCEAIVHAAAAIEHDPHAVAVSLVNCAGTQRMLELAELAGAERFAYISGVPVIGRPRRLPVDEEHPVDPPTAYHAAKLYGERLVELARRRGLAAASLRLTSPVGPGMPPGRIMSVFVRSAVEGRPLEVAGSGSRAQDYIDVRDAAAAVEACLARGEAGLYNVAAGRAVSNLELADACVATFASSSEVLVGARPDPEDEVRWEVSIERARARLGFEPRHGLAESIRAVAEDSPG